MKVKKKMEVILLLFWIL